MGSASDSELTAAAAHWDRAFGEWASVEQQSSSYALASSLFQRRYINPHFGADAPDWIEGLRRALELERPFERLLALGCGLGEGIIHLQLRGVAAHVHGIDLSETAVAGARAAAARAGIADRATFDVGDFHSHPLAKESYDVALMVMSLHHALDLDLVLSRVRSALRPGGLLVVNEYIGPNRWQFTAAQLSLVNLLLKLIPERLRRKQDGSTKRSVGRPSVQAMLAMDPSEAAHSQEIPAKLAQHFRLLHRVDYGGAVAIPVLDEIIANFREDDARAMSWFQLVTGVDKLARKLRLVPSANAFLVGRRE